MLQAEELLVDQPGIRPAAVDEKVVIGIVDFEFAGARQPPAIVLVQDETTYARVMEPLLLEQRPIYEGVDGDVVIGVEVDDNRGNARGIVGHHPALDTSPDILVDAEKHPGSDQKKRR